MANPPRALSRRTEHVREGEHELTLSIDSPGEIRSEIEGRWKWSFAKRSYSVPPRAREGDEEEEELLLVVGDVRKVDPPSITLYNIHAHRHAGTYHLDHIAEEWTEQDASNVSRSKKKTIRVVSIELEVYEQWEFALARPGTTLRLGDREENEPRLRPGALRGDSSSRWVILRAAPDEYSSYGRSLRSLNDVLSSLHSAFVSLSEIPRGFDVGEWPLGSAAVGVELLTKGSVVPDRGPSKQSAMVSIDGVRYDFSIGEYPRDSGMWLPKGPFVAFSSWNDVDASLFRPSDRLDLRLEFQTSSRIENALGSTITPDASGSFLSVQQRLFSNGSWRSERAFEVHSIDSDAFDLPERLKRTLHSWTLEELSPYLEATSPHESVHALRIKGGTVATTLIEVDPLRQSTDDVQIVLEAERRVSLDRPTALRWYAVPAFSRTDPSAAFGAPGPDSNEWAGVPRRLNILRHFLERLLLYANRDVGEFPFADRAFVRPIIPSANSPDASHLSGEDVLSFSVSALENATGTNSQSVFCVMAFEEDERCLVRLAPDEEERGEIVHVPRIGSPFVPHESLASALLSLSQIHSSPASHWSPDGAVSARARAENADLRAESSRVIDSPPLTEHFSPSLVPCSASRRLAHVFVVVIRAEQASIPGEIVRAAIEADRALHSPSREIESERIESIVVDRIRSEHPASTERAMLDDPDHWDWIVRPALNRVRAYRWIERSMAPHLSKQVSSGGLDLLHVDDKSLASEWPSYIDSETAARDLNIRRISGSSDGYWITDPDLFVRGTTSNPADASASPFVPIVPGEHESKLLFDRYTGELDTSWPKRIFLSMKDGSLEEAVRSILRDEKERHLVYSLHRTQMLERIPHEGRIATRMRDLRAWLEADPALSGFDPLGVPLMRVIAQLKAVQERTERAASSTKFGRTHRAMTSHVHSFRHHIVQVFVPRTLALYEMLASFGPASSSFLNPSARDLSSLRSTDEWRRVVRASPEQERFVDEFFDVPPMAARTASRADFDGIMADASVALSIIEPLEGADPILGPPPVSRADHPPLARRRPSPPLPFGITTLPTTTSEPPRRKSVFDSLPKFDSRTTLERMERSWSVDTPLGIRKSERFRKEGTFGTEGIDSNPPTLVSIALAKLIDPSRPRSLAHVRASDPTAGIVYRAKRIDSMLSELWFSTPPSRQTRDSYDDFLDVVSSYSYLTKRMIFHGMDDKFKRDFLMNVREFQSAYLRLEVLRPVLTDAIRNIIRAYRDAMRDLAEAPSDDPSKWAALSFDGFHAKASNYIAIATTSGATRESFEEMRAVFERASSGYEEGMARADRMTREADRVLRAKFSPDAHALATSLVEKYREEVVRNVESKRRDVIERYLKVGRDANEIALKSGADVREHLDAYERAIRAYERKSSEDLSPEELGAKEKSFVRKALRVEARIAQLSEQISKVYHSPSWVFLGTGRFPAPSEVDRFEAAVRPAFDAEVLDAMKKDAKEAHDVDAAEMQKRHRKIRKALVRAGKELKEALVTVIETNRANRMRLQLMEDEAKRSKLEIARKAHDERMAKYEADLKAMRASHSEAEKSKKEEEAKRLALEMERITREKSEEENASREIQRAHAERESERRTAEARRSRLFFEPRRASEERFEAERKRLESLAPSGSDSLDHRMEELTDENTQVVLRSLAEQVRDEASPVPNAMIAGSFAQDHGSASAVALGTEFMRRLHVYRSLVEHIRLIGEDPPEDSMRIERAFDAVKQDPSNVHVFAGLVDRFISGAGVRAYALARLRHMPPDKTPRGLFDEFVETASHSRDIVAAFDALDEMIVDPNGWAHRFLRKYVIAKSEGSAVDLGGWEDALRLGDPSSSVPARPTPPPAGSDQKPKILYERMAKVRSDAHAILRNEPNAIPYIEMAASPGYAYGTFARIAHSHASARPSSGAQAAQTTLESVSKRLSDRLNRIVANVSGGDDHEKVAAEVESAWSDSIEEASVEVNAKSDLLRKLEEIRDRVVKTIFDGLDAVSDDVSEIKRGWWSSTRDDIPARRLADPQAGGFSEMRGASSAVCAYLGVWSSAQTGWKQWIESSQNRLLLTEKLGLGSNSESLARMAASGLFLSSLSLLGAMSPAKSSSKFDSLSAISKLVMGAWFEGRAGEAYAYARSHMLHDFVAVDLAEEGSLSIREGEYVIEESNVSVVPIAWTSVDLDAENFSRHWPVEHPWFQRAVPDSIASDRAVPTSESDSGALLVRALATEILYHLSVFFEEKTKNSSSSSSGNKRGSFEMREKYSDNASWNAIVETMLLLRRWIKIKNSDESSPLPKWTEPDVSKLKVDSLVKALSRGFENVATGLSVFLVSDGKGGHTSTGNTHEGGTVGHAALESATKIITQVLVGSNAEDPLWFRRENASRSIENFVRMASESGGEHAAMIASRVRSVLTDERTNKRDRLESTPRLVWPLLVSLRSLRHIYGEVIASEGDRSPKRLAFVERVHSHALSFYYSRIIGPPSASLQGSSLADNPKVPRFGEPNIYDRHAIVRSQPPEGEPKHFEHLSRPVFLPVLRFASKAIEYDYFHPDAVASALSSSAYSVAAKRIDFGTLSEWIRLLKRYNQPLDQHRALTFLVGSVLGKRHSRALFCIDHTPFLTEPAASPGYSERWTSTAPSRPPRFSGYASPPDIGAAEPHRVAHIESRGWHCLVKNARGRWLNVSQWSLPQGYALLSHPDPRKKRVRDGLFVCSSSRAAYASIKRGEISSTRLPVGYLSIDLPDAVDYANHEDEVFLSTDKSPLFPDGCIVIEEDQCSDWIERFGERVRGRRTTGKISATTLVKENADQKKALSGATIAQYSTVLRDLLDAWSRDHGKAMEDRIKGGFDKFSVVPHVLDDPKLAAVIGSIKERSLEFAEEARRSMQAAESATANAPTQKAIEEEASKFKETLERIDERAKLYFERTLQVVDEVLKRHEVDLKEVGERRSHVKKAEEAAKKFGSLAKRAVWAGP